MKRIIAIALLMAAAQFGFAQGTVNFNTAVSSTSTISYAPGSALGGAAGTKVDGTAHPTAQAALYAGPAGATEAQLVLVTPISGFASGSLAGYITAGSRSIPGFAQGASGVVVQIRAWDALTTTAQSYEAAQGIAGAYLGKSILYTLGALGGPGDANANPPILPATPAAIANQVGFVINVPEPSSLALALMGLGGFFMLRRKK